VSSHRSFRRKTAVCKDDSAARPCEISSAAGERESKFDAVIENGELSSTDDRVVNQVIA